MKNFNNSEFLTHYWQKKPVVLRQLFPGFRDIVNENELAGLAMEPELDSRLVRLYKNQWSVIQGPFEHFDDCKGHWTLLVQGVDKYLPEASELMSQFTFIPNWRIDDLMISYAVEGAGVGPHIDQYDVFLIQGKGRRRWRVGEPHHTTEVRPTAQLCQVTDFTPIIDCELNTGDVLYIPPGWPHDGKTIVPSLTYSVGYRAPDQQQLAGFLAEYFHQVPSSNQRYTDASRQQRDNPTYVDNQDVITLKALLHQAIDSPDFSQYLLQMLSEQTLEPEVPEVNWTAFELEAALREGHCLVKSPGCRPIINTQFPEQVFINGELFAFSAEYFLQLASLLTQQEISFSDFTPRSAHPPFLAFFTQVVNAGYWALSNEHSS